MARVLLALLLGFSSGCCCGPVGGVVAACARSEECAAHGRCTVRTERAGDSGWVCYAGSESGCARSRTCADEGRCHVSTAVALDRCVALVPNDCVGSTGCRTDGRCTLGSDGSCVASFAGCTRSEPCAAAGVCAFDPVRARCVVGEAAPACERPCAEEGACTSADRACVATSASACRASVACRARGRCSLDPAAQACVAASDDECAGSGACIASIDPNAEPLCRLVPEGAYCIDERDACERASCFFQGRCDAREGLCLARSSEECAASVLCRVRGTCSDENGWCLPGSAEDCAESLECAVYGRCRFEQRTCLAPGETYAVYDLEYCSIHCELYGQCLRTPDRRCVTFEEAGLPPDVIPIGSPSPPPPPPVHPATERALALLESYAEDLSEVADRLEERIAEREHRGSLDDPRSPFWRVPSPAIGTPLAAREDVLEVDVTRATTRLLVRTLHGGRSSTGSQSREGALDRGRDVLAAWCPSLLSDEPDAVDLVLRRDGDGPQLTVAVRAPGVCVSVADRERRAAEVSAARERVGAEEQAYFAYLDRVLAVCPRRVTRQPPPGDLAELPGFVAIVASCMHGDSGWHRTWLSRAPDMGAASVHRGAYRPLPNRYVAYRVDSESGLEVLHVEITEPDGDQADADVYFRSTR